MSKSTVKEVTQEELVDIASLMAQELEDFIREAEKAGCDNPLPGTRMLLEEWEAIFKRTDFYWKNAILKDCDEPDSGCFKNL